jgi:hypothetical protein
MAVPPPKDFAMLYMAALIYVFDKDKPSLSTAFDQAKEFIKEVEKRVPGAFDDA